MKPEQHFHMYVLPYARHDSQIVGLRAVPGRLPDVHRLPGETAHQLTRRALLMAAPGPSFCVEPILKGDAC